MRQYELGFSIHRSDTRSAPVTRPYYGPAARCKSFWMSPRRGGMLHEVFLIDEAISYLDLLGLVNRVSVSHGNLIWISIPFNYLVYPTAN